MPSEAQQQPDIFVTETMAELSARQGRTAEAIAIYRRLLGGAAPGDERRARWTARLATLEGGAAASNDAGAAGPPSSSGAAPASAAPRPAASPPAPAQETESALRLPLVVRQPVRAGQIVYAQGTDLIVLAPVNPGAQLLADGNIHVYAPLRGRAVAGVRGARDAQIFCLRLDAELVGVDAAYLVAEDIPAALRGQAVRVALEEGRCRLAPLQASETRASY
jgi:septum site-determining protein MinC